VDGSVCSAVTAVARGFLQMSDHALAVIVPVLSGLVLDATRCGAVWLTGLAGLGSVAGGGGRRGSAEPACASLCLTHVVRDSGEGKEVC